jgi:DeoR family glycerol-3-phosphate regulon repressor
MDFDLEEAEFARMVLSCGERKVVVTDHTKFGRRGLVNVCGFDCIDELITDAPPPDEIAAALERDGTTLTIAEDQSRSSPA